MSIFLFDKKERCVVNPDALKLTTYLKKISKDEFYYIVLAYDYESPYHQLPEDDRKLKARRQVFKSGGGDDIETGNENLIQAVREYKSLQYDPQREILNNYIDRIKKLNNEFLNETNMDKLVKLDKTIALIQKRAEDMQQKINKSLSSMEVKGKRKLNYIEIWQANQVEFKRDQQNNEIFDQKLS